MQAVGEFLGVGFARFLVLGKFRVSGFSKEPTQVSVTFAIDSDGIVKVTARDGAGRDQSLTVMASSGLTADEIARMAADSNQYLADRKAILEKGRTEVAASVGNTGSGGALIARVTEAIEEARAAIGEATIPELLALAEKLTTMAKTLRKTP